MLVWFNRLYGLIQTLTVSWASSAHTGADFKTGEIGRTRSPSIGAVPPPGDEGLHPARLLQWDCRTCSPNTTKKGTWRWIFTDNRSSHTEPAAPPKPTCNAVDAWARGLGDRVTAATHYVTCTSSDYDIPTIFSVKILVGRWQQTFFAFESLKLF